MLLIPNALCWSSRKCNCACALPAEVQLRLRITRRSWQKLFAGRNFVKILVTAQTQLRSYSEQQRAFGNSNICNWLKFETFFCNVVSLLYFFVKIWSQNNPKTAKLVYKRVKFSWAAIYIVPLEPENVDVHSALPWQNRVTDILIISRFMPITVQGFHWLERRGCYLEIIKCQLLCFVMEGQMVLALRGRYVNVLVHLQIVCGTSLPKTNISTTILKTTHSYTKFCTRII